MQGGVMHKKTASLLYHVFPELAAPRGMSSCMLAADACGGIMNGKHVRLVSCICNACD